MAFRGSLGISDFRKLRTAGFDYVDKTRFIASVLTDSAKALLFLRPRRFGKTLNLSALAYFVGQHKDDRSELFEDLAIWKHPEARVHFQRYPVIFLTFKEVKHDTYERTFESIRSELQTLYGQHKQLLTDGTLESHEAARFERILHREATEDDAQRSVRDLSTYLARRAQEQVVILIDEYDTPIVSGYLGGFLDQATSFFRGLMSQAFKDNPALFKGVMSGILRVAKESLFSGLNHVIVYSMLNRAYETAFGFTEAEVHDILTRAQMSASTQAEAKAWYNGYRFGDAVIYNPWSILSYADQGELEPYWVNTSANDLIFELLARRGLGLSEDMEALLQGQTVRVRLDENLVLRDLDQREDVIWSFLTFAGYLKPVQVDRHQGDVFADVAIVNQEVRYVYRRVFSDWLERGLKKTRHVDTLVAALLGGDAETAEALLSELLRTVLSFHDPAGREPEKLYHGLILGLLVHLEGSHRVRSNRESGYGRADVLISSKTSGEPGVVLELKVPRKGDTVEATLEAAGQQIIERRYVTELEAQGARPIYAYAVVFEGKDAFVRRVVEGA